MSKQTFRIAVIPGDGIGKEVVPVGLQMLEALQESSNGTLAFEFDWWHEIGDLKHPAGFANREAKRESWLFFGEVC